MSKSTDDFDLKKALGKVSGSPTKFLMVYSGSSGVLRIDAKGVAKSEDMKESDVKKQTGMSSVASGTVTKQSGEYIFIVDKGSAKDVADKVAKICKDNGAGSIKAQAYEKGKEPTDDDSEDSGGKDPELVKGLKAAKRGPQQFVIVIQGSADGLLKVGKKVLGQISKIRNEAGGGKLAYGRVTFADGNFVFEVEDGPVDPVGKLATKLGREAGLSGMSAISKEFGEDDEDEDEDDDGEEILLKRNLKKAKRARVEKYMHCALVGTRPNGMKLFIGKRRIPRSKLTAARQEVKASRFFKGRCFNEDGFLVFEFLKRANSKWARMLKKYAKQEARVMIKPIVRIWGNPPADDLAEMDQDEAEFTSSEAELFQERWDEIRQELDELKDNPPASFREMVSQLATARDAGRQNDYSRGNSLLDRIDQLLEELPSGETDDELETEEDEGEGNIPPPPPPPPPTAGNQKSAYTGRLAALRTMLKEVLVLRPDNGVELRNMYDEAKKLGDAESYDDALSKLTDLEKAIRDTEALLAKTTFENLPEEAAANPSIRALNQARVEWNTMLAEVRRQLESVKGALRQTDEADLAGELDQVLDLVQYNLVEELDRGLNTSGEARQAIYTDVLGMLRTIEEDVLGDDLVAVLDECPMVTVNIQNTLRSYLARIARGLTTEATTAA